MLDLVLKDKLVVHVVPETYSTYNGELTVMT